MTVKLCTVYDSKGECFMPPNCYKNLGEALREFEECANDPKSKISKWAADYTLFELGTFDEATAKFVIHTAPVSLGNALQFVRNDVVASNAA